MGLRLSRRGAWVIMPAMFRRTLTFIALLCLSGAASAQAQEGGTAESLDEEARAVFSAGSTAFDDARYDDALTYFQRAYELSQRSVLLYNVGVAADRMRRDRVALEAFERFLEEVPDHPRRRDVEARVIVLRQIVADADAAAAAHVGEPEAVGEDTPPPATVPPDEGPDALSIAGPIVLGTLGLAGVVAAIVGIAGAGSCIERESGACVEERQVGWVGVGIYGGLGLASIAGAIVWAVVAMSGGAPDDDAPVAMTPNGLAFRWSN